MCLINTAMICGNRAGYGMDILCVNVVSMRYACRTKMVFDLLQKLAFKDHDVFMHMFVSTKLYPIMTRVLNDNRHVVIYPSMDWISDVT